jgi:hypothetical protein
MVEGRTNNEHCLIMLQGESPRALRRHGMVRAFPAAQCVIKKELDP